ncbi:hypothetical protein BM523_04075 [Alteromonas mediterranea]|jgi:hypothetical protein|uniref:Lipoprotein n=2 Tax=Alteromonas mediterranea TaxID=314275 RepID=S5AKN6_9ALTE|nr:MULTISPECIES: hypothetical protein [Alteromonas]AGP77193.1 hypothetical protein I633_04830 [Alteromonas mediterranea 615]AGP92702.1 hypothetical protein I634_04860 [Alteromonas mediterranea U8]MBR9896795.1 hypothetical protein [Gammaproteobacteria bacterium]AEA97115.2 hypothetical protein MADE_1004845 [Alteromonas mediterranea DE]AGP80877.1 hypothetical protein I533_04440 [Alteromonas mediterranea MED64]|tara:strand:+ start:2189 stop:2587 length:399 start_codon:yes stop_codon:yes gene_type:complete
MFKQFTRLILPFALTISAAGCTNSPTVTKADIPLVHSSLAYSLAPDKELAINIPKANLYHDTKESFSIRFNGYDYKAIKHYISATGNKCIRFSLQDGETTPSGAQRKVTTCQRDGQWRVISPLVASATAQGE